MGKPDYAELERRVTMAEAKIERLERAVKALPTWAFQQK